MKAIFAAIATLASFSAPALGAGRQVTITFNIPGLPPSHHAAPWRPGETVEQAMQQAGIKYVTEWYPKLGNALMIAENTPSFISTSAGSSYWWLCINGKNPGVGMTAARINSHNADIEWYWTQEEKCQ